ncbi:MAG: UbiD family decarboxylase [Marinilabiliales bacterium]|nr:UbiD family decarboxylase [Marinilabiliales bacterium]
MVARFVTLPMVITKDPITGIRNVGMYRMQVFDKSLTGMHWHMHKVGARHFSEYKKLGKKMPIAVALGGDPAYTYSATAPLPDNVDEFLFCRISKKEEG